jgi:predicted RecB family nuclease
MYFKEGALKLSPSDLTQFMRSPFASYMDRKAAEFPEIKALRNDDDAMMKSLQKKGYTHEDNIVEELKQEGLRVVEISNDGSQSQQVADTLLALCSGADVVTQARLELNDFGGYADYLVKAPGDSLLGDYHYEVWDAKLSKTVKPYFAIQMCLYAEMLEEIQGRLPDRVLVVLGNGVRHPIPLSDCYAYYKSLKRDFLSFLADFDPEQEPDPADSSSWGNWEAYAKQLLAERDHLIQVANINRSQIKKLNAAGIYTMAELAVTSERVPGLNPQIFERLKAQASIQIESRGSDVPAFRVLPHKAGDKLGLALLPPASPQDIFFDIEGYPLDDGGLEYLWGATYFDDAKVRQFRDFWAHDHEQEKQAFQEFIAWTYGRWTKDPSMHIYHYANYEIAACRKLMGRYGICEHEVDQLLRNEVFVDLYKVVKGGILLGEPRYSIKNVEHLYRGKRDTDVASGGDSVAVYEEWRDKHAAGKEGATWDTSPILKSIRDYNIDDCDSTQELVDWLRARQEEVGITFLGKEPVEERELKEEIVERNELRDQLLAKAGELQDSDPARSTLTANLAWMLEFERREAKPIFWKLFDRLGMNAEELADDLECLANCERTSRAPFKLSDNPRARKKGYEYQFDTLQEFKGAASSFYLLGEEKEDGKPLKANYSTEYSDLENGFVVLENTKFLPDYVTLIPDQYVNPASIPEAINNQVAAFEKGKLEPSAIIDFLTRAKPRIKGHEAGTALVDNALPSSERLKRVTEIVQNLDNSYLTIQGPPGAGKSYTAKHVITELVRIGAKVGITSNSHKAINHLLISTAKQCKEECVNGDFICTKNTDSELEELGISVVTNGDIAERVEPGCVIGTTAWGFTRADMAGQLDYLFVDEAGQVATARLLAVSQSANNLVLLGDQMQLGQPSQASHPGESGLSVLDYLLHEKPTIPADMGIFLDTTYRMHEAVNRFISEQIYEGRLHSDPSTNDRYIELAENSPAYLKRAGIIHIPVDHSGNTQASDEEVERIQEIVRDLLQARIVADKHGLRKVSLSDMMFVAPYNHQVRKLQEALGRGAKVGSVDKFQGQEAPIVFLSMCSSGANDSPRGLDFLLDSHRINVAVSRAQVLVFVVSSKGFLQGGVGNLAQLRKFNMMSAIGA